MLEADGAAENDRLRLQRRGENRAARNLIETEDRKSARYQIDIGQIQSAGGFGTLSPGGVAPKDRRDARMSIDYRTPVESGEGATFPQ